MRLPHVLALSCATILTVVFASLAAAAGEPATSPQLSSAQSRITVSGTSNLHDWQVVANGVRAAVTLPVGFLDGASAVQPTGTFTLPARALRSDKDRMNELMWKALAADRHRDLTFELRGARVKEHAAEGATIEVQGLLTVAGKGKSIAITLQLQRQADRLVARGEIPLLMSDFGISPPTALLGTLRTGDRVVVGLEVTLAPAGG